MTQRFDPSLINQLVNGGGSASAVPNVVGTVASLVDEAICSAVDWVCGGDIRSARVCVDHGSDRTWILVDSYTPQGSSIVEYIARTNDLDLMCGAPPTFHVSDADPGVVHAQAAQFLTSKYDGKDISVKVFRSERSTSEPTLEASTTDPTFREQGSLPTD